VTGRSFGIWRTTIRPGRLTAELAMSAACAEASVAAGGSGRDPARPFRLAPAGILAETACLAGPVATTGGDSVRGMRRDVPGRRFQTS
jgi:hypothetical protein